MNKKCKAFFVFVVALAFVQVFSFAQTGSRVYEYGGGFSFCPPAEWRVTEIPGLKYNVIIGPVEGQFSANINFADEVFNGTVQDYVNYNLAALETGPQKYTLLSRKPFITNSGMRGECVIMNSAQQNVYLRQVFYFLPIGTDKYIVITCSVLDEFAEKYLFFFEECAKTFEPIR